MTDQEIIATFMEPKPGQRPEACIDSGAPSPKGWWMAVYWNPPICLPNWQSALDHCSPIARLGYLWEVEERLTDEQWHEYDALFSVRTVGKGDLAAMKIYLHSKAEEKIKALATVLRPIVCP